MPANTYTLIEKITVGAAGASSIEFTSIPQTYTDLKIVLSARANYASTISAIFIKINNDTAANYKRIRIFSDGSSASSYTTGGTNDSNVAISAGANANSGTASTFSNFEFYIPNYTSSNQKSISIDGVTENNSTTAYAQLQASLWTGTSAITSLTITAEGNFNQYSTFYLYGVAKEGVSPSPSSAPYATGGDSIVFDGTYWIHTFTSSGTFTPQKSLTCDYLVVAGGGGGSATRGGGGGAGGMRCTVTATGGGGSLESALSLSAQAYTVTVGAGGAGDSWASNTNTNGSNSVFATITSTGGGKGGYSQTNGSSGGSGGGSGNESVNNGQRTGGAGTANQGYAGGQHSAPSGRPDTNCGGGGGAGAVGSNGTWNGSVAGGGGGGAGVATSISGSSVTYAGGGGGTVDSSGGGGTGGSGGGGNGGGSSTNGTAGTANTGGGGGGGKYSSPSTSGAGGSGIVIVRYAA